LPGKLVWNLIKTGIARSGNIYQPLLDELNSIKFYQQPGPNSLGREWVETFIYPVLEKYNLSLKDTLRNFYEHAAYQISVLLKAEIC
jgi:anhydro-N-acetylmuramic acid kinase